jgi:hypothetical protein
MRVGLVVDQLFAQVPGGTGRYAGELASALTLAAPPQSSLQPWSAWHRPRTPGAKPSSLPSSLPSRQARRRHIRLDADRARPS